MGLFNFRPRFASDKPSPIITLEQPAAIYAIGDIHGCLDQLKRLEDQIFADAKSIDGDKIVVTLGDYVDRGLASSRVIDWLMHPLPDGFRRVSLKGNHEAMMLQAYDAPAKAQNWMGVGGAETLQSYGITAEQFLGMSPKTRKQVLDSFIPTEHIDFLRALPLMARIGDFAFVHAGIRPGVALERQSEQDMLWIREPFLSTPHGQPAIVVHGHTPDPAVSNLPYRIGIDTGAYAGGPLTAVSLKPGYAPEFLQA